MSDEIPQRNSSSHQLVKPDPLTSPNNLPVSGDRRTSARIETPYNAVASIGPVAFTVEVRNVSQRGAQIRIRQGLTPSAGQLVTLSFMNSAVVEGQVVWSDGNMAGLRFVNQDNIYWDAIHFEEMGADYYTAVLKFQSASV